MVGLGTTGMLFSHPEEILAGLSWECELLGVKGTPRWTGGGVTAPRDCGLLTPAFIWLCSRHPSKFSFGWSISLLCLGGRETNFLILLRDICHGGGTIALGENPLIREH